MCIYVCVRVTYAQRMKSGAENVFWDSDPSGHGGYKETGEMGRKD